MQLLALLASLVMSITQPTDLGGRTLTLKPGTVLEFGAEGSLSHGTVIGADSRIIAPEGRWVLDDVLLQGSWQGAARDGMFRLEDGEDAWPVLSSLIRFEDVTLSPRDYLIDTWKDLHLREGDIHIHGNGARLLLPADKGELYSTPWGMRYRIECLFGSMPCKGAAIIEDMQLIDAEPTESPLYDCFELCHSSITLERVSHDGKGGLLGVYSNTHRTDSIVVRGCVSHSSQFAVEVNVRDKASVGSITIEDCRFDRPADAIYVGPLSFVAHGAPISGIRIRGNEFVEANDGNVEIAGAVTVLFEDNDCTNMFSYSGDNSPEYYICRDNRLTLRDWADVGKATVLGIAGKRVEMKGNSITVTQKPFPGMTVVNPEQTRFIEISGNSILYAPDTNDDSPACLFNFRNLDHAVVRIFGNRFKSRWLTPMFENYLPRKAEILEDPCKGRVRYTRL